MLTWDAGLAGNSLPYYATTAPLLIFSVATLRFRSNEHLENILPLKTNPSSLLFWKHQINSTWLFYLQDSSLLEARFEETCVECDHGLIHCDEQLSRQRKSKNPTADTVLEKSFYNTFPGNLRHWLKLISIPFLVITYHSQIFWEHLLNQSMTLAVLFLKRFFLPVQKLEVFQEDVPERQSAAHHCRVSCMHLVCRASPHGWEACRLTYWRWSSKMFRKTVRDRIFSAPDLVPVKIMPA